MITFFTHCRPFRGEFDELQRVAIASWRSAVPGCQIILMGDDESVARPADELGADWVGPIPTNDHGTPLVSIIFGYGEEYGRHEWLCEISSDIVLGGDFQDALEAIQKIERPFVVGQRWDIDPGAPPERATLHPPSAADYFIYRRGTLGEIPPFAVGRTAYDNWLIWAAIHEWGLTAIDATDAITAVHINHGYPEYGTKQRMIQSEERKENFRLMLETAPRHYQVDDAPYVLRDGEVVKR